MSCERRMSVWWMESSDDGSSKDQWKISHVTCKWSLTFKVFKLKLRKENEKQQIFLGTSVFPMAWILWLVKSNQWSIINALWWPANAIAILHFFGEILTPTILFSFIFLFLICFLLIIFIFFYLLSFNYFYLY